MPAVPVAVVVDEVAPVWEPVLPVPCSALVGPQLVRLDSVPPLLVDPPVELDPELPEPEDCPEPELEFDPDPELPDPEDCARADVARPSESAVTARILVIIGFPLVAFCFLRRLNNRIRRMFPPSAIKGLRHLQAIPIKLGASPA